MNKRPLLVWGLLLGLIRSVQAQPCDFKGYPTIKISDFVENGTTKKVAPTYPQKAKRLGLSGSIYVRVLINDKGRVEKACVDPKLSSISESTLVEAAQNAAMKWTFVPNFGLPIVPKAWKGRYLEGLVKFNFLLRRREPARKSDKKNSAG